MPNVQPNKLFGAVTTGISFKGVMMDVGHVRHNRWVLDDSLDINAAPNNPPANASVETRKRWIAYNKIRGQYASALEHAIPERFFNDTTQCNAPGAIATTTPPFDANKPACTEGISAVKAIAIAQSQGQKVFTINQQNAAQAIPLLSHRGSVIDEVSASVAAGKEVTIHERAITANGWSGAGYSVVDPETGAGAYLIEGGARGAILLILGIAICMLAVFLPPPLSVIVLALGLLLVGCGLSAISGDDRYFDAYALISVGLIAGLLEAASAGAASFVIPFILEAALIFSNADDTCANLDGVGK